MAKHQLMQHQREGVKFLQSVDGVGALLYDPGTGKTGTTLSYIDSLADEQGEVRVLVVAPLTAADTWVLQPPDFMDSPTKARFLQGPTKTLLGYLAESRDWTKVTKTKIATDHPGETAKAVSGNRVTILAMSSGAISSWCKAGERTKMVQMLRAVRKYDPHLVVVDESHTIKSAVSNLSKAMYQIGLLAPRRIILTGTVQPHGPMDVYGQWRFLAPWTFSDWYGQDFTEDPATMTKAQIAKVRPWAFGRFKDRYTVSGGYQNHQIVGYVNLTELKDRVAERAHVVRKEDALDLPPVTDVDIHVTLTPTERKAYEQMKKDLAAQMADGSLLEVPNALAKIMKLRQITSGFAKDTDTGEVHILGRAKQKAACDIVNTTLVGETRLVVFAYFKKECADLAAELRKTNKDAIVEVITGETKPKDRLAIRRRFKDVSGNPQRMILVAQQSTMAVSVNELVTAQNAVFCSMSERRDIWVQSRGRLDRNGQVGNKVTFWNVLVPDTVDSIMRDRHVDRGNLEKALFDHIKGV